MKSALKKWQSQLVGRLSANENGNGEWPVEGKDGV
jgi:hypothetical protein